MSGRVPLMLLCGDCRHEWPGVWLPMDRRKQAAVLRHVHCPACAAGPDRVFLRPPARRKRRKAA